MSKKLKIAVYAISKNEEQFVKRFCDSAKDADYILIADTGSTDDTVKIAEECGATVQTICITPWRFDHARNAALALVPRDIDICISIDLDEVLEPGWREAVEEAWTDGVTRLRYLYDWGCGISFYYEKFHARHGYFWHHPCHEYPVTDARITEVWGQIDKLVVRHLPDTTKSRGQYLDLLALSVKEDPDCPRNAFYYARELSFYNHYEKAIEESNRYLSLPKATWGNERCYAYRVIAKCQDELGRWDLAEAAFQRASAEAPNTREPWVGMAELYYKQARWMDCYAAAMRALSIVNREAVYTCDPEVWGYKPHDLAAISAWNLGLHKQAIEQGIEAVNKAPDDERLKNNLAWYQTKAVKEELPVPNIVHFIHFTGDSVTHRPFSYVNYLAVKSASDVQKPDAIYVYYNVEPEGNSYWGAMKQIPGVKLVQMEAPTEYNGVSLSGYPQYQADVVRLQKLYEMGGIYQDTDAITLKNLDCFRNEKCVLSGLDSNTPEFCVNNSTIIASKGSEFIKLWLDGLAEGLSKGVWAWHATNLPTELYLKNKELVRIVDSGVFLPFHFKDDSFLTATSPEDVSASFAKSKDAYVVHLWEAYYSNIVPFIDKGYVDRSETPLSQILRNVAA